MRVWRALAVFLVSTGLLSLPAAAGAAGFVVQPSPAPVVPQGTLYSVSCSASTACTAVGSTVSAAAATVPVAERWNGAVWSLQSVPAATGAAASRLVAVSCPTSAACTAVGFYLDGAGTSQALVERWTASGWSIVKPALPAGTTSSALSAITCVSASACTAVGQYVNYFGSQGTLALFWNGSAWSAQTTPNPAGSTSSTLTSVSCLSTSACTAVGSYTAASRTFAAAEVWNGVRWKLTAAVNPAGATKTVLAGVACPTSTSCTAVGYTTNGSGVQLAVAESWNGSAWSLESIPYPAGASNVALRSVACTSASACTATGSFANASSSSLPLAEGWNGTGWSIETAPLPTGATTGGLRGVACATATACLAVGSGGVSLQATLAESWNGTSWSIKKTPSPAGAVTSELHGVSCTASTSCAAAGYYYGSAGTALTLAELWNGSGWSIQTTPNPAGATRSTFNSVSCSASASCVAAGYFSDATGTELPLVERWSGTSWTIQTVPAPTGARDTLLASVACPSATACSAVGDYVSSADVKTTLAETWNGTAWTISPTPVPSGATASILRGVSCRAASQCTAVGSYVSAGQTLTLAERWNGTSWAIQSTPNASGATSQQLTGVSCASATACTAIGTYLNSGGAPMPVSENWNGSTWVLTTPVVPAGASTATLTAVACTAATACTSVGYSAAGSGAPQTLAETWNGTSWAIKPTAAPAGAPSDELDSVACTGTACTATGYARYSVSRPLVMAG